MKTADEQFVLDLVAAIPPLKSLLSDHIADNDELLPHVFMGEITRAAVRWQKAARHSKEADAWVRILLDKLERGEETGGNSIRELVAASFLENLDLDIPAASELADRLGPLLSKQLRLMRPDRP